MFFRRCLARMRLKNVIFLLFLTFGIGAVYYFSSESSGSIKFLKPSIKIENSKFLLKGKPIQIISGAVHYFRVPPEYWHDRLKKLKACGLNTVETYVPWNLHEKTKGNFDFRKNLDIKKFLRIAHELDLYVIFRPGPYICAEWDLGGLPGWLLSDAEMRVRSTYPGYLRAVEQYFKVLIPKIVPYLMVNGGPIIMVQIENEYGSYRRPDGKEYLEWLRNLLIQQGVTELLFTSDGFEDGRLEAGSLAGTLTIVNDQTHITDALKTLKEFQPNMPLMIGEYWTGWFDHWNETHHTYPLKEFEVTLKEILSSGASVNLYMFHGGTNFGLTNGANTKYPPNDLGKADTTKPGIYKPTVTSYDYDALLTENGRITDKYLSACRIIAQYQTEGSYQGNLDEIQALRQELGPATEAHGNFLVRKYLTVTEALQFLPSQRLETLVPMEQICSAIKDADNDCVGQNFGFIAYRTWIPEGKGAIRIKMKFADRAIIIVNNRTKATIESYVEDKITDFGLNLPEKGPRDLVILVENMGRVNYQTYPKTIDNQRKGIIEGQVHVMPDNELIKEWHVYSLEMDKLMLGKLKINAQWHNFDNRTEVRQPAFYRIPLRRDRMQNKATTDRPRFKYDSFLDYEGWNKGVAYINGFNLGRYWHFGPQRTLFVPGPLFTARTMPEVTMFELHRPNALVTFKREPNL